MSTTFVLFFAIVTPIFAGWEEWTNVATKCRSMDYWGEPWLVLDECADGSNTKYQGTYSTKYTCSADEKEIIEEFYWGLDCIQNDNPHYKTPAFSETILQLEYVECYNSSSWAWNSSWIWWNTTTTTLSPDTADNDKTECYNISYAYEFAFNCNDTLPACRHANYSTFVPLPEEPNCVQDEKRANWETHYEPVGFCTCYSYHDGNWTLLNGTDWEWEWDDYNTTYCYTLACNQTGIYYVEWDAVNTSLPEDQWCGDGDLNNTDGYVSVYIEEGCDGPSGQYFKMEYCPQDDDHSNLVSCIIAMILSVLMLAISF